jgi:ABC-2 type transport system ATP-binding protein
MNRALPMAVDARNLTYRYGSFTAVDDVTLQVRPGETMGLLGPNGAGKTTVVRMLCSAELTTHYVTSPTAGSRRILLRCGCGV